MDCRPSRFAVCSCQDAAPKGGNGAETQDDWSCAIFWYEPAPSEPLPPLADVKARTADIWKD